MEAPSQPPNKRNRKSARTTSSSSFASMSEDEPRKAKAPAKAKSKSKGKKANTKDLRDDDIIRLRFPHVVINPVPTPLPEDNVVRVPCVRALRRVGVHVDHPRTFTDAQIYSKAIVDDEGWVIPPIPPADGILPEPSWPIPGVSEDDGTPGRAMNCWMTYRRDYIQRVESLISGSASSKADEDKLAKDAQKSWNSFKGIKDHPTPLRTWYGEVGALNSQAHRDRFPEYKYAPKASTKKGKAAAASKQELKRVERDSRRPGASKSAHAGDATRRAHPPTNRPTHQRYYGPSTYGPGGPGSDDEYGEPEEEGMDSDDEDEDDGLYHATGAMYAAGPSRGSTRAAQERARAKQDRADDRRSKIRRDTHRHPDCPPTQQAPPPMPPIVPVEQQVSSSAGWATFEQGPALGVELALPQEAPQAWNAAVDQSQQQISMPFSWNNVPHLEPNLMQFGVPIEPDLGNMEQLHIAEPAPDATPAVVQPPPESADVFTMLDGGLNLEFGYTFPTGQALPSAFSVEGDEFGTLHGYPAAIPDTWNFNPEFVASFQEQLMSPVDPSLFSAPSPADAMVAPFSFGAGSRQVSFAPPPSVAASGSRVASFDFDNVIQYSGHEAIPSQQFVQHGSDHAAHVPHQRLFSSGSHVPMEDIPERQPSPPPQYSAAVPYSAHRRVAAQFKPQEMPRNFTPSSAIYHSSSEESDGEQPPRFAHHFLHKHPQLHSAGYAGYSQQSSPTVVQTSPQWSTTETPSPPMIPKDTRPSFAPPPPAQHQQRYDVRFVHNA